MGELHSPHGPWLPWLTPGISAFLVLNVFCLPKMAETFYRQPEAPQDLESGYSETSSISSVETESLQSTSVGRDREPRTIGLRDSSLVLSGMERLTYLSSGRTTASSTISLRHDAEATGYAMSRFLSQTDVEFSRGLRTSAAMDGMYPTHLMEADHTSMGETVFPLGDQAPRLPCDERSLSALERSIQSQTPSTTPLLS